MDVSDIRPWRYRLGGIALEISKELMCDIPLLLRAAGMTIIIYTIEFVSGAVLHLLIGKCPWKYVNPSNHTEVHKLSILGFVRIDYIPYWYILSLLFDLSSSKIQAVINEASKI